MHISSVVFYLITFALWVSYLIAVSEEKKLFSETFKQNLERFRKLSLPSNLENQIDGVIQKPDLHIPINPASIFLNDF